MSNELSRINSIHLPELAEAPAASAALDLAKVSGPQPSTLLVQQVTSLLAQTESRYPHQELDPVTSRMYMAEWLEMAVRYGKNPLAESLMQLFRDPERPNFFPSPDEIRAVLHARKVAEVSRTRAENAMKELENAKATWERERAEDIANGIERKAPVRSPRRVFPRVPARQRRSEAEIAAFVESTTTPEERAAVRERMNALLARDEVRPCA